MMPRFKRVGDLMRNCKQRIRCLRLSVIRTGGELTGSKRFYLQEGRYFRRFRLACWLLSSDHFNHPAQFFESQLALCGQNGRAPADL